MKDSTRTELAKTLAMIGGKIGGKTIIIYANADDKVLCSGGVITGETDFPTACEMSVEMTTFISEAFGDREHKEI